MIYLIYSNHLICCTCLGFYVDLLDNTLYFACLKITKLKMLDLPLCIQVNEVGDSNVSKSIYLSQASLA